MVKWHQNEVFHRLQQPVGKPCTYGKDMAELSDVEQLKLQKVSRLDKNIDKVAFIKPVEAYKPRPFRFFDVKQSTYYLWEIALK